MKALKGMLTAGAFASLTLGAGVAAADYVCYASLYPGNSGSMGTEGYAHFTTYTGANCTGSYVGVYYVCTTNATSANCPSGSNMRYERHGLLAMHRALQTAAVHDEKVNVATGSVCNGGASGCLSGVSFYAN